MLGGQSWSTGITITEYSSDHNNTLTCNCDETSNELQVKH